MFKRENKTLKGLSHGELKNLINYFNRGCGLSGPYSFIVTVSEVSIINRDLIFDITFPRSYIKKLPEELAIENILKGWV